MRRAVVALALLLPACSAGVQRATPPPGAIRPARPAVLTTPDPRGLELLRPTAWHEARYVDYRTLDVGYTEGVASCGGLADARVAETADTVTITLLYGSRRLPEGYACHMIGFSATTRVRLPHALDGRRLVDRASGETRVLG